MAQVETIKKYLAANLPNGIDESFLKKIPFLLKRIQELEEALYPLAYYYNMNENNEASTFLINKSDGARAREMLDPKQSYREEKKYEYPAR